MEASEMCYSNQGWFQQQFRFLKRQFLQDGELPFTDVLSEDIVSQALAAIDVYWMDRIYSPLITLWVFLGQVLSADHSCRAAVARLISHRISHGQQPCSSESSAYCQARKRLPEKFFSDVARQTGQALDKKADKRWLWKDRRVYAYDGSTVTMPDTLKNQRAYPQNVAQKSGLGFPIARIAGIFSLSCGALLDLGICRYAGKGQSELGMLRKLWSIFRPGDVMPADRLMCAWTEIVMLQQRSVDTVCRLNTNRSADFRRGQRLGKDDHIVKWPKPTRFRDVSRKTRKSLPDFLRVRECRVRIDQPGFRIKTLIIVTTLLDPNEFSKEDLADLYLRRWSVEADFKSLKITLQMDILRCKTPEMVRKEIWTHILAYNLIRAIIAQAASEHDLEPRTISFKGTVQTLEAFQQVIALQGDHDSTFRMQLYHQLLDAIVIHRVADRPDRFEPRLRKRRHKKYLPMLKPRRELKRDMVK